MAHDQNHPPTKFHKLEDTRTWKCNPGGVFQWESMGHLFAAGIVTEAQRDAEEARLTGASRVPDVQDVQYVGRVPRGARAITYAVRLPFGAKIALEALVARVTKLHLPATEAINAHDLEVADQALANAVQVRYVQTSSVSPDFKTGIYDPSQIDMLDELAAAVFGRQAGDEPDVYADYDKLSLLARRTHEVLAKAGRR